MSLEAFSQALARPDDRIDLAHACLLIAQDAYPGLDVERYLGEIERMALRRIRPAAGPALMLLITRQDPIARSPGQTLRDRVHSISGATRDDDLLRLASEQRRSPATYCFRCIERGTLTVCHCGGTRFHCVPRALCLLDDATGTWSQRRGVQIDQPRREEILFGLLGDRGGRVAGDDEEGVERAVLDHAHRDVRLEVGGADLVLRDHRSRPGPHPVAHVVPQELLVALAGPAVSIARQPS